MKKLFIALAAGLVVAGPALADGLSANLSLTSKYKYRGQDQSDPEKAALPAVQGGFDYAVGSFYLGNWNSSIGFADGTEMDFYGGLKGDLGGGMGYDVGLLHYYYPGRIGSDGDLDTTELYAGVSFGPATLKYSHTVSSKYFGIEDGRGTGYLDLSANFDMGSGIVINAHVGFTNLPSDAKRATGLENYADYKLGATYDLGNGLSLGGAVVGATKKDVWGDINKSRFVLTLTKAM